MNAPDVREYELPAWLQPYTSEFEPLGQPMLHHKFYVGFVFPMLLGKQPSPEECIAYKQKAANEALAEGNWNQYIWLHERPYRAGALSEMLDKRGAASGDEIGATCRDVWVDSENITQYLEVWDEIFNSMSGYSWMESGDRAAIEALPETFTVYRGVCEDGDYSWTLSSDVADFFANRGTHNSTGEVISRQVSKQDVWAYTDARTEQEVLILP